MNLSRRGAIATGIGSLLSAPLIGGAAQRPTTSLGLCQYCGRFARQLAQEQGAPHDLFRPESFFEHARALGAGGYQVELGILTPRRAAELRDQAEAAGDLRTALAAIREARGNLELLARLLGELQEQQVVNILISPQWVTVRAAIVAALAPYPEARLAVSERLSNVGA